MCGFLFFVTFSAPFQIAAEPANHAAKYWHGAKRCFNFVNKSLGWCLCVRVCGWVDQKKKCDVHSLTLQYYISTSLTNTACLDIMSLNPTHAHTHTHVIKLQQHALCQVHLSTYGFTISNTPIHKGGLWEEAGIWAVVNELGEEGWGTRHQRSLSLSLPSSFDLIKTWTVPSHVRHQRNPGPGERKWPERHMGGRNSMTDGPLALFALLCPSLRHLLRTPQSQVSKKKNLCMFFRRFSFSCLCSLSLPFLSTSRCLPIRISIKPRCHVSYKIKDGLGEAAASCSRSAADHDFITSKQRRLPKLTISVTNSLDILQSQVKWENFYFRHYLMKNDSVMTINQSSFTIN